MAIALGVDLWGLACPCGVCAQIIIFDRCVELASLVEAKLVCSFLEEKPARPADGRASAAAAAGGKPVAAPPAEKQTELSDLLKALQSLDKRTGGVFGAGTRVSLRFPVAALVP